MSEHDWLTSTDPAAMVAFLGERITDEQRRYFVEVCHKELASVIPISNWDAKTDGEIRGAFQAWVDWKKEAIISRPIRCDILRDIVPFKSVGYVEDGVLWLDRGYTKDHNHSHVWEQVDWLQWNDGAIPSMVDAMMFDDCGDCKGSGIAAIGIYDDGERYSCPTCDNGRIPRAEPRWSDMLVIADALETAGCSEPAILEHLRSERDGERCSWCYNGRVRIGYLRKDCSHCNGTGRIKRRHWKGCHILELLSHQPSGTGERV